MTAEVVQGVEGVESEQALAVDRYPLLSARDIRTFDTEAKALVMQAQDAGWRGYLTNQGHVFLYAPDGTETMSVSRSSLRGRSGRNAKAALTRWLKAQQPGPARTPVPGEALGVSQWATPIDRAEEFALPRSMLIEFRRSGARDWFAGIMTSGAKHGRDYALWAPMLDEHTMVDEHCWFAVELRPYRLVAHGRSLTAERVQEIVGQLYPWVFPTKDTARAPAGGDIEQDNSAGGATMKMLACTYEGCDYRTAHAGAMNLHRSKHGVGEVACTECSKVFKTMGAMAAHRASHDQRILLCPPCDKTLVGPKGFSTHLSRAHKGQVPAPQAVELTAEQDAERRAAAKAKGEARAKAGGVLAAPADSAPVVDGGATVAPPQATGGADVLMDHLLAVPQGDDAEAMVAQIRAVVAAPLVADLRRLREDNERLEAAVKELDRRNGELEARLALMRDALTV